MSELAEVPWSQLTPLSSLAASEGVGGVALLDQPLLVLVGVTGVGKSTTLARLAEKVPLRVLPDRRELADRVVLPAAQEDLGEPVEPVRDRVERFRLTAHYRASHPGGLAQALASLVLRSAPGPDEILIFDGIRGVDECSWAAVHLARARFVALVAPPAVRLGRLLARSSPFDRTAAVGGTGEIETLYDELPELREQVPPETLAGLAGEARARGLSRREIAARAAVLVEERRNYDPDAAVAALRERLGPERLLVLDTAALDPASVAEAIARWAA